jgi:hypothetical protein
MSKIYWRSPGTKREPDSKEELLHSTHGSEHRRISGLFGGGGRSSLVSKADSERQILIRDILSVSSDCVSDVFQRSIAKHYVGIDGCNVMCLTSAGRTLDLEIEEASQRFK